VFFDVCNANLTIEALPVVSDGTVRRQLRARNPASRRLLPA
jgi:hypothetical protein